MLSSKGNSKLKNLEWRNNMSPLIYGSSMTMQTNGKEQNTTNIDINVTTRRCPTRALTKIELFLRWERSSLPEVPLNHSWPLTRKQMQVHVPTQTRARISRWRLTACFGANEEHMSLSLCDGFHMLPQPHTPPGREDGQRVCAVMCARKKER